MPELPPPHLRRPRPPQVLQMSLITVSLSIYVCPYHRDSSESGALFSPVFIVTLLLHCIINQYLFGLPCSEISLLLSSDSNLSVKVKGLSQQQIWLFSRSQTLWIMHVREDTSWKHDRKEDSKTADVSRREMT